MYYTLLIASLTFSSTCPDVQPMSNFNTSEYIRSTWYIQQQQITGYQPNNTLKPIWLPFMVSNPMRIVGYARLSAAVIPSNGSVPESWGELDEQMAAFSCCHCAPVVRLAARGWPKGRERYSASLSLQDRPQVELQAEDGC